ncbi:MAG: LysR family transcriptional regulator [Butyricicoccus pullicaecorum]|nr:LysR family transcriptional regulator [Butyricicoccus pullicaecorum]
MDTKYIRYFLQVCDDHSFSKAAQNLFLTQQGLSAVIQRLENELGVPLFERSTSGVALTPYGSYVRSQWKHIMEIQDATMSTLNSMRSGYKTVIKVAVSFGVISSLPPQYLDTFERLYPQIHLQLAEYTDQECEEALLQGHADVGFNIFPVDESIFSIHPVVQDYMCILAHESNPLSQLDRVSFKDLRDAKLLLLNNKFKLRHIFDKKCRAAGFEPQIALETMELILIHNFSRMNKGIGVSVYFIGNDLANVKAIPFDTPDCHWKVCACLKKGRAASPAVSAFWNYVLEQPCWLPSKSLRDSSYHRRQK